MVVFSCRYFERRFLLTLVLVDNGFLRCPVFLCVFRTCDIPGLADVPLFVESSFSVSAEGSRCTGVGYVQGRESPGVVGVDFTPKITGRGYSDRTPRTDRRSLSE